MRPGKKPFVLQHPDDDAGSDALLLRERSNDVCTPWRGGEELLPRRFGNKIAGGPLIGFLFLFGAVIVGLVEENAFLAVQKDMRRLVEEAEPEMVIGLVSSGQLNDSLPGR